MNNAAAKRITLELNERYANEISAYTSEQLRPSLVKILSGMDSGKNKRSLVVGSLHPVLITAVSDWVGTGGTVAVAADEQGAGAVAGVKRSNVSAINRTNVKPGAYDFVYAARTLFPAGVEKAAHMKWLRSLPAPGGYLLLDEEEYSGWQYIPTNLAGMTLLEKVSEATKDNIHAAIELPRDFENVGLRATLVAKNAILPASSFLGRIPIEKARAFAAAGIIPDKAGIGALADRATKEVETAHRWVSAPVQVFAYAKVPPVR